MFRLAALIEQNSRQLAQISTIENGSTIMTTSYPRLGWVAEVPLFRWAGADKIQGSHGEHVGRPRARL